MTQLELHLNKYLKFKVNSELDLNKLELVVGLKTQQHNPSQMKPDLTKQTDRAPKTSKWPNTYVIEETKILRGNAGGGNRKTFQ